MCIPWTIRRVRSTFSTGKIILRPRAKGRHLSLRHVANQRDAAPGSRLTRLAGRVVLEEIDVANHADQLPIVHNRHGPKLVESQKVSHLMKRGV